MSGACILVIRRDGRFSSLLRDAGFEVLNLELIKTKALRDQTELDEKLARISEYEGLFFTSPVSAEVFVERIRAVGAFAGKLLVLGERAKKVLERAGFEVVYVDSANTAAELINSIGMPEFAGRKFLFLRGDKSMRTIPRMLSDAATIDEVTVYETIEVAPGEDIVLEIRSRLQDGLIEWVCFFSPSGVDSFRNLISLDFADVPVATIGETSAMRAREAGMNVRYVSPRPNAEEFAGGIIERCRLDEHAPTGD